MFSTKINAPLSNDYKPEQDSSPEFYGSDGSYYQSLIDIFRWIVELSRTDICCEVSMISSHMALPREGHLAQVFHIFAYLKKHHNSALLFDPSYPDVNIYTSPKHDWKKLYGDSKEAMPPDTSEPFWKEVIMCCFVDADHAGEKLTRSSRYSFIIFVHMEPIY